jgi:hypothetical protein
MAPKEPYKIHSLKDHIKDTKKGVSADAQYNRRLGKRSNPAVKVEPASSVAGIFGRNDADDDDDDSGSSDNSSDDDGGSVFLAKLMAKNNTAAQRRTKTDEIADSDAERQATSTKQSKAKIEPQSSDEDEEEDNGKQPNGTKDEASSAESGTSSEESSDSSDSDESDSDDESVAAQEPRKTAAKSVESDADTSDESDEDDESSSSAGGAKVAKPVNGKGTTATTTTTTETSSSGSSSEDTSDESSSEKAESEAESSESEEDGEEQAAVDESMHISDREDSSQLAVPNFLAPDFVLRKGQDGANGQDVVEVCNQANLEGKQLWYFTVPANVPVSVVQNLEIPMNQAQQGGSVLSHNGEQYGISFDSMIPKSSIQILIPAADGPQYRPCTFYHLGEPAFDGLANTYHSAEAG